MAISVPTFFPSAFYSEVVRIDTPASNVPIVYENDRKFFARNKGRKLCIRARYMAEFGLCMHDAIIGPPIQVLVVELAKGIHMVIAVFVGKSFFEGNDLTDSDVAQILIEMERLRGIDPAAWNAFVLSWNEYKKATESSAKHEAIN